jgi:hypothetical protein
MLIRRDKSKNLNSLLSFVFLQRFILFVYICIRLFSFFIFKAAFPVSSFIISQMLNNENKAKIIIRITRIKNKIKNQIAS